MNGDLFAPTKRFSTGIADPPWKEQGGGKVKRGADRHYPLMSTDAIAALPVFDLFEPDAHLYLWVTNNFLEDGLQVMKAWGFRYVTNLCWGKVKVRDFTPINWKSLDEVMLIQQGLGQYFRGAHELLLFGVRGRVPYRTLPFCEHGVAVSLHCQSCPGLVARARRAQNSSLVLAPRGKHSVKPDVFHRIVEKVSPGPYVELFARRPMEGWAVWGNEIDSTVDITGATT